MGKERQNLQEDPKYTPVIFIIYVRVKDLNVN